MTDRGPVLPTRSGQVCVERGTDTVTVHVTGEIDIVNGTDVTAGLRSAAELEPRPASVVVDLTGVPFLDSSALGALLDAGRRLRERDIAFRVVIPGGAPTRRVVELVGLVEVLNVTE